MIFVLACTWFLPACQFSSRGLPPAAPAWQYADLRALDPADAPHPDQDLVALSLRHEQGQVQIRLDWLDIGLERSCDVRLDFYAIGSDQPVLSIRLDANGDVQTSRVLNSLRVRWDDFYDDLVISFLSDIYWLRAIYQISAQTLDSQTQTPLDEIGPVFSNGMPPPTVSVLLAFWNTFEAATPAQALRQWDGAHSGPQRERHGLRYLLAAVQEMNTPIVLLDIKTPTALSALDAAGGLDELRQLAAKGLVLLPDAIPVGETFPNVTQRIASESRQAGLDFGFKPGPFFYTAQASSYPNGYDFGFAFLEDAPSSRTRCQGLPIIPLSGSPTPGQPVSQDFSPQATNDGPSAEIRKLLANAHQYSGYAQIGGDFSADNWGSPRAALNTLRYIAARPWLNVMDENDLRQLNPGQTCPTTLGEWVNPLYQNLLAEIENAPENALKQAAWQMLQSLMTPAAPRLAELREEYAGQIGHLLAAARWADAPAARSDCEQDVDWDGQAECTLSSEMFFAIIERDGGYISMAAAIVNEEAHQVIAPSWQLAVGLSDLMGWKSQQGVASDPGAMPGAFFDPQDRWRPYTADAKPGEVILQGEVDSKVFRVTESGLIVIYSGEKENSQMISLAVDAWRRFRPDWADGYISNASPQGLEWGLAGGPTIQLSSGEASFEITAFADALPFLNSPEDPNLGYPAGHYLPFPLAVVTVKNMGRVEIQIR